jgi:hypothetical protein
MSSPFFSVGDDPLAHLRKHFADISDSQFNGIWATVELQPDLFAPQRFTIGVAVGVPNSGFAFRLISEAKKFECVYGKSGISYIRTLIESAEYTLLRSEKARLPLDQVVFECSNLTLSPIWPTSGTSPERVLARLFGEVVAMEPSTDKATREFVSLDTEQVRQLVASELKRIGGLKYERLAVEPKEVVLADDASGETHVLDLSLRTENGAGSVLSAVYKTPSIIELNLLRASRDLAVYGRVRKINDLALFVMSAKRELFEPVEYGRISDLLDEQSWRLERQGFQVVVFDEALCLANSIYEWAALAE